MSDEAKIRALVHNHFEGLKGNDREKADCTRYRQDFFPGAVLCGAARPAQDRSLGEFVHRMETAPFRKM